MVLSNDCKAIGKIPRSGKFNKGKYIVSAKYKSRKMSNSKLKLKRIRSQSKQRIKKRI